jgi:hypothetical protein
MDYKASGVTITSLSVHLYHASISATNFPLCAHAFSKLAIFPPEHGGSRFFTVTRAAGNKISAILDATSILAFQDNTITISKEPWRALSLSLGSHTDFQGVGPCGAVVKVLAQSSIPIFYVSTAHTDFIIIHETDLSKSLSVLSGKFRIIKDDRKSNYPDILTTDLHLDPLKLKQTVLSRDNSEPPVYFVPRPNLEWTLFPNQKIFISSLNKEKRVETAYPLLKSLFFSESLFFSFTETEDEVSILFEEIDLDNFPEHAIAAADEWIPMERFKKESLNEIGVISTISQILTAANISILYLSTFETSYVMVRSTDLELTKMILQTANYKTINYEEKAATPREIGDSAK